MREINLGFHQQSECVNRQRPCEYGCFESEAVPELERVVTKVPSKLMSLHLKYDCPERPVRCSLCLQDVKAKLTVVHDMQECGKRPVSCRVEVRMMSSFCDLVVSTELLTLLVYCRDV